MNVVICPSWYPQNKDDMAGSFFRDQAIALKNQGHRIFIFLVELQSFKQLFTGPFWKVEHHVDEQMDVYKCKVRAVMPPLYPRLFDWHGLAIKKLVFHAFLRRLQKEGKAADVIHAHSSFYAGYLAIFASKRNNIPLVVTEHWSVLIAESYNRRLYKTLEDTLCNSASFIFVSNSFKNAVMHNLQFTSGKVTVIPNMVDTHTFTLRKKQNNKFSILVLCGLNKSKGVHYVIDAFELSFKNSPQVELLIGGDGVERNTLMQQAKEKSSRDRIFFLGAVHRSKVPELMGSQHLFVMTSQPETFGIVYIEALACGIPIIGTQGQGVEDIVNSFNGLLVEYGNVQELSRAMMHIYEHYSAYDPELIREDAIKRFSQESVSQRITEVYQKVCGKDSRLI